MHKWLVIAGVLLLSGGMATYLFTAKHGQSSDIIAIATESTKHGSDQLATASSVRLNRSVPTMEIITAEDAQQQMEWWEHQEWFVIEDFQKWYQAVEKNALALEVYATVDGWVVYCAATNARNLDEQKGWALIDNAGNLVEFNPDDPKPERDFTVKVIDEKTAIRLAQLCQQLAAVDNGRWYMMPDDKILLVTAADWEPVCDGWTVSKSITTSSSANGANGHQVEIAIGADGLLKNYENYSWHACSVRRSCLIRCGTKASTPTIDDEPPLPMANN